MKIFNFCLKNLGCVCFLVCYVRKYVFFSRLTIDKEKTHFWSKMSAPICLLCFLPSDAFKHFYYIGNCFLFVTLRFIASEVLKRNKDCEKETLPFANELNLIFVFMLIDEVLDGEIKIAVGYFVIFVKKFSTIQYLLSKRINLPHLLKK